MAIVYLDVDDEITTAAARIRAAADLEIALVLPAGSRIATSRMNFRLLAHEAAGRSRRLAIVAPEGSARSLAASAGLPVFATIPEYEEARGLGPDAGADAEATPIPSASPRPGGPAAARERGDAGPRGGSHARPLQPGGVGGAAAARPGPEARTVPGGGRAAEHGSGAPDRPDGDRGSRGAIGASTGLGGSGMPSGRRGRRRWPILVAAVLALAVVGGAGAAVGYVVLPTATVTLRLVAVPVGPVSFEGVADPTAVAVDAATATFPAARIAIPLAATGTFPATGKRVEATAATGRVRWTNCDPTRSYTIPRATPARTANGLAFLTQEDVFLPVAVLDPPRITCQSRTVDVVAGREGPASNVAAGTITVVPGSYNDVVIKVTNPDATSGGSREEFPQVAEKDVTAAITALTAQLDAQLEEVAPAPPGVPAGATVFPGTARRADAVPSVDTTTLVGQEIESFELTLEAEGSVVVADPAPLEEIALARVTAEVPEGMELRDGSATVEVGEGTVDGEVVRFPVTARAEAVREITADEVRTLVRGATAAEAEDALAPYGDPEVVLWPDWATAVTTLDARLEIVIVPLEGPAPGRSPAPTAAP